ncbi:hypothetical protein KKF84_10560, partial [Myxococcota bacterium]|nr:hypothetical protein [Myxococcota bacterium]MBU1535753.1 hypothetical protein [Myxococcota bacterium]
MLLFCGAAAARFPNSLVSRDTAGKNSRLFALTTISGKTTLAVYGKERSILISVVLPQRATTLCVSKSHVVVAHTGGTLSLYSHKLVLQKKTSSVPILALVCSDSHFYTGGKSIKVVKWSYSPFAPVKVMGEHASFVNNLFLHPRGGLLSVSWDHEAVWFATDGKKTRFPFPSTPVHAVVSEVHNTLAIITDAQRLRFFTLEGNKRNWKRSPHSRCLATSGDTLLVGLANGFIDRYLFKKKRFHKTDRLSVLPRSPIDALLPLWDGWWAISSKGTLHFKKF